MDNPRPDDIECLCKLLTTVGMPMDMSQRTFKKHDGKIDTTQEAMHVYFRRIEALSNNEALDARHRFMLKDLIELRRNKWVLRRKVSERCV